MNEIEMCEICKKKEECSIKSEDIIECEKFEE